MRERGNAKLCEAVNQTYRVREEMIIIGLTGRTGAGCSTVSRILEKHSFAELDLKQAKEYDFLSSEERKNRVIQKYMREDGRWLHFDIIEVSSIILACVLEGGEAQLRNYLLKISDPSSEHCVSIGNREMILEAIKGLGYMYEAAKEFSLNDFTQKEYAENQKYYEFYINQIKRFKKTLRGILEPYACYIEHRDKNMGKTQEWCDLYTYLMQCFGNNIRSSGSPFEESFSPDNYMKFVRRIDAVVQIIKTNAQGNPVRIGIDAIRNPYEALYFRDKYKSFYLMAISTDDTDRRSRLRNLSEIELNNLDRVEYAQKMQAPEQVFYHQNISGCLEIADIHIYNPNVNDGKYFGLTEQLVKYIALMIHPGLVTPTHLERCMQLAYNSKYNSGCLSRQVGAVVTREDFSVQSVGWNDVPKGQIPCALRDVSSFCSTKDRESFSEFELQNPDFNQVMQKLNEVCGNSGNGRCMAYCFKDIYNGMTRKSNQVYTRSLHAEENAFLQISKYGGTEVKGGCLFTTASPCELCAKKAYQLGIKNIYYIDPYPGISKSHILTFGNLGNPKMNLFYGAIGNAYLDFYTPRIPAKDELELVTGIDMKALAENYKNQEPVHLKYEDISYQEIHATLTFDDGGSIINTHIAKGTVHKEELDRFEKRIAWTGCTYDDTTLIKEFSDEDMDVEMKPERLPYSYDIVCTEKRKKDDSFQYGLRTEVKDEKKIMDPYFAFMVHHKTDALTLCVKAKPKLIQNVHLSVYADLDMKLKIDRITIEQQETEDFQIYSSSLAKPNVNYTYAIEWDWVDR